MIWWALIAASLACYGLKLVGLSVPQRVLEHPTTVRVAALIPVGLLGALVAVQVFADGTALVLDARLVGIGVAVVLLVLRAPFLVIVFAAALATALVRLL
ncbi:branched-subunit amino acid transport protein AzlD [Mumia flava]|uniref:Branched-subunit amino acid transport protein AzlD n=1 Tax=Mumia flava TaxID=1348852 RepID=A0A0B2BLA6_9ACTN|nr:AzlD domain-containing protein [Mumia flava]PJJ56255.1 branched-subunit amino acid transport protein AzlD [Mumia flava]